MWWRAAGNGGLGVGEGTHVRGARCVGQCRRAVGWVAREHSQERQGRIHPFCQIVLYPVTALPNSSASSASPTTRSSPAGARAQAAAQLRRTRQGC